MAERAYLWAIGIDPLKVGETYAGLNRHLTMLHWFRSKAMYGELAHAALPIFAATPPIPFRAGQPDLFGPNHDVPVHVIEPNPQLTRLHQQLNAAMEKVGITHTAPEYVGDGWHPHVTTNRGGAFPTGTEHLGDTVYLVRALDPHALERKFVLAGFPLGGIVEH